MYLFITTIQMLNVTLTNADKHGKYGKCHLFIYNINSNAEYLVTLTHFFIKRQCYI